MSKNRVVFFFPWKELSGGPIYLTTLANDLSKDAAYDVFYVDYDSGLSESMLCNSVKKISYTEPFSMPDIGSVTIITPLYCAMHIPKIDKNSRIVFLNWHNFCTRALVDTWRLSAKELQRFLGMIKQNDALFFLDRSHWLAQNEWMPLNDYFREKYVPIKRKLSLLRCRTELIQDHTINVAILGRLSRDKAYGVLNLLEQMEESSFLGEKHVIIIGDGEMSSLITDRTWRNNIRLDMTGTVTGEKLSKILAEQADILFAMGTSALEGASISLPTVIIPHNVTPFSCNRFTWLYECNGYAVGWYDTQIEEMNIPTHHLDDILEDIYGGGQKTFWGQKCFDYVKKKHSENVSKLKECLSDSTLTYKEFENFSKHQGFIRIGGIPLAKITSSFDGKERNVNLFGIKNFFQYRTGDGKKEFVMFGRPQKWIIVVKEGESLRLYIRVPFIKV